MAMTQNRIPLFQSTLHACGYYPERMAQNVMLHPASPQRHEHYPLLLAHGFRRSGDQVYRPHCPQCSACKASRVRVDAFVPNRSQKRCLKRNADLDIEVVPARFDEAVYQLYRRYLEARHRGGGMDDSDREDFERFLCTPWSPTRFVLMRHHGELVACAVTDQSVDGYSAVYTFFDPQSAQRSLGVFGVLTQLRLTREAGLPYLYLGYWIEGHPKMHYKTQYRPIELFERGQWHEFDALTLQEKAQRSETR